MQQPEMNDGCKTISVVVVVVAMQHAASALFPAAAVDAGGSCALQRTDVAVSRAAEARSDVHGDQQQHRPSLPTEGLRPSHSLPQGSQPAKTRQVGHQSADRFPPPGAVLLFLFPY